MIRKNWEDMAYLPRVEFINHTSRKGEHIKSYLLITKRNYLMIFTYIQVNHREPFFPETTILTSVRQWGVGTLPIPHKFQKHDV